MTSLMNKCLEMGDIIDECRRATMKLLYKGKGDTGSLESCKEVALEAAAFKILMKFLV